MKSFIEELTDRIVKRYERELSWLNVNKKPEPISEVNIHSYTRYSVDGLVVEKYERISTAKDTSCEYSNGILSKLPKFYGEWTKATDEAIDKINKEILEKAKKRRAAMSQVNIDTSKVDASDLDEEARMKLAVQKAYMILQKKLKEKEDKENAGKTGNDRPNK